MNNFPSTELPGRRQSRKPTTSAHGGTNTGPGDKKETMNSKFKTAKPTLTKSRRSRISPDIAELLRRSMKPVWAVREKGTKRDVGQGVYTNGSDFFFANLDDGIPVGPVKPLTVLEALKYTRVAGMTAVLAKQPVEIHHDSHSDLMYAASQLIERLEEKVGAR